MQRLVRPGTKVLLFLPCPWAPVLAHLPSQLQEATDHQAQLNIQDETAQEDLSSEPFCTIFPRACIINKNFQTGVINLGSRTQDFYFAFLR